MESRTLLSPKQIMAMYFPVIPGTRRGMSADRLRAMARRDEIPYRRIGGRYFFPKDAFEEWMGTRSKEETEIIRLVEE